MDIEDLRLFIDAARLGSFAEAARARAADPSSVSRSIAFLEKGLGFRLFNRTTRQLSLTDAGALYLARAESLVEELDRAREEAANLATALSGTLRITASVTFGERVILPLLPEVRWLHPDLQIEALFTDANLDLVAERIDVAVRLAPAIEGDLIVTKLADTHYRIVASPSYVETAKPLATPQDLSGHGCLVFTFRPFRSRWIFRDRQGAMTEVPIRAAIAVSPAGSLRESAIAGLGPALLPDWLVDEDIAAGRLVRLFADHAVTATTFDTAAWIVYPTRAYLPAKVRFMVDFLKERLGRRQ
jgi:DNA-binding transcriptional LysR family regulator